VTCSKQWVRRVTTWCETCDTSVSSSNPANRLVIACALHVPHRHLVGQGLPSSIVTCMLLYPCCSFCCRSLPLIWRQQCCKRLCQQMHSCRLRCGCGGSSSFQGGLHRGSSGGVTAARLQSMKTRWVLWCGLCAACGCIFLEHLGASCLHAGCNAGNEFGS
jgi:hypothetical protein